MARIASQIRMGYYPAPPEAIAHAATFLRVTPGAEFAMLDPCAGEGMAIKQLAAILGCRPKNVYAVELEEGRADTIRENLPESNILAPASIFGCHVSPKSFQFLWLNPPFDTSFGGGRVENQFLERAMGWLAPGGILALVTTEEAAKEFGDLDTTLKEEFTRVLTVPFPAEHRRFNEVVIFAVRREQSLPRWAQREYGWKAPQGTVYTIPPASGREVGPRSFKKIEPTDAELRRMLDASPLRTVWTKPSVKPAPSPPLAIGPGHVALLLAGGHLDGVVQPEGEVPHVVRGSAQKEKYLAESRDNLDDEGKVTSVTETYKERIVLTVRTIGPAGGITTLMSTQKQADAKGGSP